MSGFLDITRPCLAGYPTYVSPRWNTSIASTSGGHEQRNQNWEHPLNHYQLAEAVQKQATINSLLALWRVTAGPLKSWPWRDPLDYATVDVIRPHVAPAVSAFDVSLGVAENDQTDFQLVKTYTYGGQTYTRTIHLPIVSTVLIAVNGTPTTAFTVSRPGGVVTLDDPLNEGDTVTGGCEFDVEVRFEADDTFDAVIKAFRATARADVNLVEVRPC